MEVSCGSLQEIRPRCCSCEPRQRMLSELLPPGGKTICVEVSSRVRRWTPLAVQNLRVQLDQSSSSFVGLGRGRTPWVIFHPSQRWSRAVWKMAVRGTSNSRGRTAALSISTAFSRSPRSAIGYPANPTHGWRPEANDARWLTQAGWMQGR